MEKLIDRFKALYKFDTWGIDIPQMDTVPKRPYFFRITEGDGYQRLNRCITKDNVNEYYTLTETLERNGQTLRLTVSPFALRNDAYEGLLCALISPEPFERLDNNRKGGSEICFTHPSSDTTQLAFVTHNVLIRISALGNSMEAKKEVEILFKKINSQIAE